MSELRNSLQAALGEQYRIERELGGGGMSRVFEAEEVRLGRRVVIKVLPPETSAAIEAGRFGREIQVAASLHHPHIVQLLAAGEGGGLLWYVMPFVEGESLAERLARTGPLPVAEAVRVLREVADALAYAHTRGIVHRDIKPPNIMLSGRHALVTDFGVAKAVSVSAERGGTLTSIGMALGTPAYMAPEQAVADPNVDHRADLYSLGVVAYEMLTGRLPYDATTPQAMLAAHVTQPAIPIERLRADLSPDVAGIVMRCLAKSPDDRFESASAMVDALESIGTPSGGSAAYQAFSAQHSFRRWHPGRVLITHLIATVIVAALAFELTRVLGLPDWVWWAATGAMVLGLPPLLIASRNERRRAHATMTGMHAAVRSGEFTGRRAIAGGMLALGIVVLLAGGFVASRVFGIGPGATLLTAGRLASSDRLLLADFQNTTRDSTINSAVVEALRVDLSQSRAIHLVPANEVSATLQRMGTADTTRLTADQWRDVAQRANAKAVLTGEIHALGSGYVLSASVVDAVSGQPLLQVRETAVTDKDLIPAVNHLSLAVRKKVGESLRGIRASEPLEQVTTASLPALRLYTEAMRVADRGDYDHARDLLVQAVKIDTAFAMAWRKLAVAYGNIGNNRVLQLDASRRAFQFRDRLTTMERHLTEANYYNNVANAPDQAIAAYREALAIDPDDRVSLNNAGLLLNKLGRFAEGEAMLRHGLATGNLRNFYENLGESLIGQDKFAAADSLSRQWLSRGGDSVYGAGLDLNSAVARRNFRRADSLVTAVRAMQGSNASTRRLFQFVEVSLDQYRGRLGDAERTLSDISTALAADGDRAAPYNARLGRLMDDALQRGRPEAAWQSAVAMMREPGFDSIPAGDRPYGSIGDIAALAGKPAEVARLRVQAEVSHPAGERDSAFTPFWDARVAVAAGRWDSAAAAYQRASELAHCRPCGDYERAYSLDRAGKTDSALAAYSRTVESTLTGSADEDASFYPLALRRIGEIYAERGDKQKAIDYLTRFTTLWKDADPDLQPIVKQAKQRVAELTGEPRKP